MVPSQKTVIGKIETTEKLLKGRKGQACFVQYNGQAPGHRYIIVKEELFVGREANCDICLAEKGVYKNGLREGTWHAYTLVDGNLWKTGNYKEGMKEGIWNTYSIGVEDKNIVRWKINYNKNKRDGTYKRYFGNGKIDLEGKCKDGKKYGYWKKYLFEGGLTYTKDYKDKDALC